MESRAVPEREEPQPIYQLEIRPEMRDSVEFRLLIKALLAAAREELAWKNERRTEEAGS
jgi:hypothetical protein